MLNLSLNELRLIAENRVIKGYKSMSVDKLLSMLQKSKPEPIKGNETIRGIRRENYDADKILRDIRTLFESDQKEYYKPIRIGNAFSNNYIEYECNGDKDNMLSIEEYLDKIEPYLNDLTDDHKTQGEWKIQLIMVINFISSKDSDETCTTHTKRDSIEIMIGNEKNEITE